MLIRSDSPSSSGGSADGNWSLPSPPLPPIEGKRLVATTGSVQHLEQIEHRTNHPHYHHGARLPKLPSFHGIPIRKYLPHWEKSQMYT